MMKKNKIPSTTKIIPKGSSQVRLATDVSAGRKTAIPSAKKIMSTILARKTSA
jgi:hypothetical protein